MATNPPIHTEHEALVAFGQPVMTPHRVVKDGVPYLVHRNDQQISSVEGMLPQPTRTRHTLKAHSMAAFVAAVLDYARPDSRIYADRDSMTMTCVVDHYAASQPEWGQHLIVYKMKLSPDWTVWTDCNKRKFEQIEFADWLEDNALVITDPKPAAIIELARNLEIRQSGMFKQASRVQDGSFDLTYTVNNEAVNVKVPERLRIELPVCVGDQTNVQLEARFRWRVADNRTRFFYDLYRVDDVLDRYWADVSKHAEDATKVKTLQGQY